MKQDWTVNEINCSDQRTERSVCVWGGVLRSDMPKAFIQRRNAAESKTSPRVGTTPPEKWVIVLAVAIHSLQFWWFSSYNVKKQLKIFLLFCLTKEVAGSRDALDGKTIWWNQKPQELHKRLRMDLFPVTGFFWWDFWNSRGEKALSTVNAGTLASLLMKGFNLISESGDLPSPAPMKFPFLSWPTMDMAGAISWAEVPDWTRKKNGESKMNTSWFQLADSVWPASFCFPAFVTTMDWTGRFQIQSQNQLFFPNKWQRKKWTRHVFKVHSCSMC